MSKLPPSQSTRTAPFKPPSRISSASVSTSSQRSIGGTQAQSQQFRTRSAPTADKSGGIKRARSSLYRREDANQDNGGNADDDMLLDDIDDLDGLDNSFTTPGRFDFNLVDDTLLHNDPAHTIKPGAVHTNASSGHTPQHHHHHGSHQMLMGGGPPPIPLKLMARLLYEGFEEKSTKIDKDALSAVTKYAETFVREAMARAAEVRRKANQDGLGTGDEFLQVEDLEKLAPQLLLDF